CLLPPPFVPLLPYPTRFRSGLVGLKPTYGQLSNRGIFPLSPSLDTPGPIAKTVYDAALMYLSMAKRPKDIASLDERYPEQGGSLDRKSTRLNSSHVSISYAV